MSIKIDRLEIKQQSQNEYGIWDHEHDVFIVTLHDNEYDHVKTTLEQLKSIIDAAIENGDLDL